MTRMAAALDLLQDVGGASQIEHFAHAFAIGLQQNGKRGIARGHGQQIGRALALLPERRAQAGPAARQQQRAAGGLAEVGGEQRRAAKLPQHQVAQLRGGGQQRFAIRAARRSPAGG